MYNIKHEGQCLIGVTKYVMLDSRWNTVLSVWYNGGECTDFLTDTRIYKWLDVQAFMDKDYKS